MESESPERKSSVSSQAQSGTSDRSIEERIFDVLSFDATGSAKFCRNLMSDDGCPEVSLEAIECVLERSNLFFQPDPDSGMWHIANTRWLLDRAMSTERWHLDWVNVADRVPTPQHRVLVVADGEIKVASYYAALPSWAGDDAGLLLLGFLDPCGDSVGEVRFWSPVPPIHVTDRWLDISTARPYDRQTVLFMVGGDVEIGDFESDQIHGDTFGDLHGIQAVAADEIDGWMPIPEVPVSDLQATCEACGALGYICDTCYRPYGADGCSHVEPPVPCRTCSRNSGAAQ